MSSIFFLKFENIIFFKCNADQYFLYMNFNDFNLLKNISLIKVIINNGIFLKMFIEKNIQKVPGLIYVGNGMAHLQQVNIFENSSKFLVVLI